MSAALSGLIRPCRGDRFERLSEFEPGAIAAEFILVREIVFDPMDEVGDVYDTVAFDPARPTRWWTEYGLAVCLGEYELATAWWQERPARMVATPADWLRCHGAAFCIIDWNADLHAIIGRAPSVECADDWLAGKLKRELTEQARSRIQIFARGARRAAA
jgi:hypothetical protein